MSARHLKAHFRKENVRPFMRSLMPFFKVVQSIYDAILRFLSLTYFLRSEWKTGWSPIAGVLCLSLSSFRFVSHSKGYKQQ